MSRCAINEIRPDTTDRNELLTWFQLRDVYRDFKAGKASREEGESRKQGILRLHDIATQRMEGYRKLDIRLGQFFAGIECAATAYIKSDNHTEEADALIEKIYGVGMMKKAERR